MKRKIIAILVILFLGYELYQNWFLVLYAVAELACPNHNILSPRC